MKGGKCEKFRDEIGKDIEISNFTGTDLQDGWIDPRKVEGMRKKIKKKENWQIYGYYSGFNYFYISRLWKLSQNRSWFGWAWY